MASAASSISPRFRWARTSSRFAAFLSRTLPIRCWPTRWWPHCGEPRAMAELFVTAYLAALYLQLGIKVPVLRPVLILGIAVLVSGIAHLSAKDRPVIFDRHIRIMFLILVFAGVSTVGAFIQRDALDVWIKMANR